jgi:6-pyruvoyltetrahydropterin/6-carboxytetrahydropterin synthase
MIYITRRERFNAAHRLFRKDYTDEENLKVFSKCSNPNWHGHNYVLYVTVKGEINPETGFLMNLSDLSRIIKERIVEKVDHKNINLEVDFMAGKYASTEILAESIWHQIADDIENHGARLHCVRLQESENNYVEYFGE